MSNRIIEAIGRCNPDEPLLPGDPRWYDFDTIRGVELHKRISRRLQGAEARARFSHITLAGHRGCGKSTELARLMVDVKVEGYLPLYAVVNEQADPNEVSYGDVILLMLRLLEEAFRDPNIHLKPLPDKTVRVVLDWFREVTRFEEQEIERSLEYAGEAGLGFATPLARLLSGLTALLKTTGKKRLEIREAVEKYPFQLQQNINLLLDDARKIAQKKFPRGFIFILDNLDRYPPEMISKTVLTHAELFKGIQAHTIFVVPISLLYEPIGETIEDRYESETLPMLPIFVQQAPRTANADALKALSEAIYQRVPPELFVNGTLTEEIARLSGGCPRDLLHILNQALLESNEQIDEKVVRRAANIVRGEIARKLNREHYVVLARVHLDTTINSDETGRFLLYRRAALEYNGERWIGVHPLLWDTPEFKTALDTEKRTRGLP